MTVRLDALYQALTTGAGGTRRDSEGLGSVFESLGGQTVGARGVRLTSQPTLGPDDVDAILAHDWRGRREIVQPMRDLVRALVKLSGLPSWVDVDAVQSYLEGHEVDGRREGSPITALGDLWGEGESYGGAVLIAVTEDGLPSSEPLDRARITAVRSWEVLDRYSVWPYRRGGPGAPVDYWIVQGHGLTGATIRPGQIVHPSRLIVHEGMWMPRRWRLAHDGWGLSRLELLRDERESLTVGNSALGRLLTRASQDVVALAELSEIIENEGLAWVTQKAAALSAKLDSSGLLVLDGGAEGSKLGDDPGRKGDSFQTMARNMSGAAPIADQQHSNWRRGSDQPTVVADGEVSGGLATGAEAGAWRAWGGVIASIHKMTWSRWLNWQLGLIFASKLGPTGGRVPETWVATWESIAEPDPTLEATTAKAWAEVDKISIELGMYTEAEAAQHRNVDGKGGPVMIKTTDRLPMPDEVGRSDSAFAAAMAADRHEHDNAAIVVVIPDSIAVLFPYRPKEPSPPHVTVLFVGPTQWDQITDVRETTARLAVGVLPMTATIGQLGYFEKPDGSRVAWVGVEFSADVAALHEQLRSQLMADGVMVQHPARPYVAHATLAYLAAGEDYAGPVPPAGLSWIVERLEVWHGES